VFQQEGNTGWLRGGRGDAVSTPAAISYWPAANYKKYNAMKLALECIVVLRVTTRWSTGFNKAGSPQNKKESKKKCCRG